MSSLTVTFQNSNAFPIIHIISFKGTFINHVVNFLGIFDPFPPSWSLLLNKAYVLKWPFEGVYKPLGQTRGGCSDDHNDHNT